MVGLTEYNEMLPFLLIRDIKINFFSEKKEISEKSEKMEDYAKYEGKSIVYVLELKDDCWYVGRTKQFQQRLEQHKNSKGTSCFWLAKHSFIKLEKIYELVDEDMDIFMEDAITINI